MSFKGAGVCLQPFFLFAQSMATGNYREICIHKPIHIQL